MRRWDEREHGGLVRGASHAVFQVLVGDVEETCGRVEALGGKVVHKVIDDGTGTDLACVHDTSGNLFGVFHRRN
ncbi:VOC family protein [Nonomuraea harbinensis]|uniref:VOC family protein n=1 Tax=Nonomuraea harbinensis TaxID=1286938 RepID=A0ABW1BME6_9ACTN|nr:VOC family protein [Nonomuraea harbinensis]